MHVAVLGAGVIGVTSACYLARAGHRVTLIDAGAGPACGTSHANGAQLAYSFAEAPGQPALLARLPRVLLGRDPAVRVRPQRGDGWWRWSAALLRECTGARARHNTRAALALTLRSAALMAALREELPVEFGHCRAGKLVLLCSRAQLDAARATCAAKRRQGCDVRVVSLDEAVEIEPAVAELGRVYAGAIYAPDDAIGDARRFCEAVTDWLAANTPTTPCFGETVLRLATEDGRLRAVSTDRGEHPVDAAVVALGVRSPALLAPCGVHLPIYPMRGYSVTLPVGEAAPRVSMSDLARRIVFTPLSGGLRIAGFGDFVGYRNDGDADRIATLLRLARDSAPRAADYAAPDPAPWAGARPMTPDGLPRVGPTAIRGLFVNTGHGMFGWTMACASGADIAAAVTAAG